MNYEYMARTVVLTVYLMIMLFDLWAFGYLIYSFVKWLRKKLRKAKDRTAQ